MTDRRPYSGCRVFVAALVGALSVGLLAMPADAQDTAKLGTRSGRKPVKLWPPPDEKKTEGEIGKPLELGGWIYRAEKSPNPRDGVPWELIVTPVGRKAELWHERSESWRKLPFSVAEPAVAAAARLGEAGGQNPGEPAVPVIIIPQSVWQAQMAADLQNAVGIHFHEFVTDDIARILYTLHKVPPDEPDGKPPVANSIPPAARVDFTPGGATESAVFRTCTPGGYRGTSGTRIEATLLAPVVFNLDQTIAVRKDQLDKTEQVDGRGKHELGHAQMSQDVFLDVLRGPQDWNLSYCTGRRSRVVFYWRREQIGRSWDGYRNHVGKLLTLRTGVVLVPPTRWSMLLPVPPERVTQQQIQAFNDAIVTAAARFEIADREAQKQYHERHGAYE